MLATPVKQTVTVARRVPETLCRLEFAEMDSVEVDEDALPEIYAVNACNKLCRV